MEIMDRLSEAEEHYKPALEADPNNVDIHSNYVVLLKNFGRLSEAEEQYQLVTELDPKNPSAFRLENEEDVIGKMKITYVSVNFSHNFAVESINGNRRVNEEI